MKKRCKNVAPPVGSNPRRNSGRKTIGECKTPLRSTGNRTQGKRYHRALCSPLTSRPPDHGRGLSRGRARGEGRFSFAYRISPTVPHSQKVTMQSYVSKGALQRPHSRFSYLDVRLAYFPSEHPHFQKIHVILHRKTHCRKKVKCTKRRRAPPKTTPSTIFTNFQKYLKI